MATTEAQLIEEGQDQEDSLSVEEGLQEVQQKAQKQKKQCLNRGICTVYTLCLVAVIVVIYMSMTRGGCGEGPNICGDESIMDQKQHGTCIDSVQNPLRWNCNRDTADRICCFNRDYAEYSGYWETTSFLDEVDRNGITTFYDSVTGKALFKAPIGRSFDDFKTESEHHGWPSFRDEEVIWENVRCLQDGETVSLDGTHLGHNLPDSKGNRYCINLVSVAGYSMNSTSTD